MDCNCQGPIGTGVFPNPNKYETMTNDHNYMVQRKSEHFKLIYRESNSDYLLYLHRTNTKNKIYL